MVNKIMYSVIKFNFTKEKSMEFLRVKYNWLYPFITETVWKLHFNLYLKKLNQHLINKYHEEKICYDCCIDFKIDNICKISVKPDLWRCFECCARQEMITNGIDPDEDEDKKCFECGNDNDRMKDGKPTLTIKGKGICLTCNILKMNNDTEEFGYLEESELL
jgi:hypothetical protein